MSLAEPAESAGKCRNWFHHRDTEETEYEAYFLSFGVKKIGDIAPIIPLTGGEERVKVIRCRLQGKHREKQGSSGFLLPPIFKFNENRFNVNIF